MRHSLNKTLNTFFLKGVFLFLSLTVQADDKEDFVYDLALATQGVSVSQYNTGINYSLGRGIYKETEKSIYWYQRASEQGHSKAPFNLAIVYAKGEGVHWLWNILDFLPKEEI
jgi:TPR repeat protein